MERLFTAECPSCQGTFICHFEEMRHSGAELWCPYCRHRFPPGDAASLDERWDDNAGGAGAPATR